MTMLCLSEYDLLVTNYSRLILFTFRSLFVGTHAR